MNLVSELELIGDPTQPISVRIEAGTRVFQAIEEAQKALEPLKEDIRAIARKGMEATGHNVQVLIGDNLTRAVVTFPAQGPTVKKGADLWGLRKTLGSTTFLTLFEETRVFKLQPNIEKILTKLPTWAQEHVLQVLHTDEGTPRVSLQGVGTGVFETPSQKV